MADTTTMSTRETYGQTLVEIGRENPDIVVLGGDLNVSTCAHLFAQEFPDRFFDLGPAEQNILSIAAGLAASGKIPFCSTFAVFGTGRAFDQIRVGIAQSGLNVKLVCTHAGLITGEDGISAQAIEDLSLMCSLPSMTVLAPADGPETISAVRAAAETPGPFYLRLYRPPTPVIHSNSFKFQLGQAELLQEGEDITIIACGSMVPGAMEAASLAAAQGISCRVLNVSTIQPIDVTAIEKAARDTGAIVTVEEHLIRGGLGSIVATVAASTKPIPMELVGLTGYAESGKPGELLEKYGLTPRHIVEAIHRCVGRK